MYGLSEDPSLESERKLLLARAGIFSPDVSHDLTTICPRHRAEYGIRWRTGKTMCSVPSPMIAHKSAKVKGTRRISSQLSSLILKETDQLIVVGSPICSTCFGHLTREEEKRLMGAGALEKGSEGPKEAKAEEEKLEGSMESGDEVKNLEGLLETGDTRLETEESTSADSDVSSAVLGALSKLEIVDETFLSPETRSTTSTQSDEIVPSQATAAEMQRSLLNEFLVAWNIPPLQRKWLDFSSCSESTKQRYTRRSSDIVAAVLKTISPEDAGLIWRAMTSTASMNNLNSEPHFLKTSAVGRRRGFRRPSARKKNPGTQGNALLVGTLIISIGEVHLEKEASIPDHCVVFSLSDASHPDYQVQCQHNHEDICEQCEALNETLREIDSRINCCHFSSDDEREEAIYILQSSKLAIYSWQCHILRSFNQDQARLDFLDLLDNETVLIVND
ncbi:unnamed protein product [Porites lobata]|uniref:Uncharacterized protein n=1 Tax=Porites lobata TaxID=104759 RepID=A0ABN8S871_9CNID|nr:unnamed protein product [Porites lobata]